MDERLPKPTATITADGATAMGWMPIDGVIRHLVVTIAARPWAVPRFYLDGVEIAAGRDLGVSDWATFDRALSADEIRAHYEAGS